MDSILYGVPRVLSRPLAALVLALCMAPAMAVSISERLREFTGTGPDEILAPEQAFLLTLESADPDGADLAWEIREGYYLYRDKYSFAVEGGDTVVDTAALSLPRGTIKEDQAFGRVEIHTGTVRIHVPWTRTSAGATSLRLRVGYQGCKDRAVCYPPQHQVLAVSWPPQVSAAVPRPGSASGFAALAGLRNAGFVVNLAAFFTVGILLSLTACMYPMVAILSGIIIGHRDHPSPWRAFGLSLAYVLAMAVTYALLGVFAGLFRFNLQAAAQAPWVVALFSGIFVLLALSMFGLFRLQMPTRIQGWIAAISSHQRAGTVHGSAVMGALSALLVGPCVAPPLAAALLYITQTGDALLGGAALFALGLGMGVPLLVLGASAGYLLPRAGYWMESVRRACGFVMIGVAVWFLGRILPGPLTLLLWGLLFLVAAIFMGALDRLEGDLPWRRMGKAFGMAFLVYGAALVVGAASGGDDPLRPLAPLTGDGGAQNATRLPFKRVSSLAALQAELDRARTAGRPVMLDFYADWCITCKAMERETFADPRVRARLSEVILLQADVTRYSSADQQLLNEFGLYGPPAILFFDAKARELRHYRVNGFVDADEFIARLVGTVSS